MLICQAARCRGWTEWQKAEDRYVVETHGEAPVEYVRSIRGTKRVCLEEGTMSG